MRHIEVQELWVLDPAAQGELEIKKVKGEESTENGLTKHVERAKMDYYNQECGFLRRRGRLEVCPRLVEIIGDCLLRNSWSSSAAMAAKMIFHGERAYEWFCCTAPRFRCWRQLLGDSFAGVVGQNSGVVLD